jgi:pilus assembly protein CpaF
VEQGVIETEPIFLRDEHGLRTAGGMPPHVERYRRANIDVHALLGGH